ncbi:MAG: rRNA maturation RNase YbeY [Ktedonobacteraceae bacterium]
MVEPEIEIYINTGNATDDEAAEQMLETLDTETAIRRTLQAVHVTQPVMLTCMVSGDAEMQALNKQHRQQDKTTDVLSFPLLDEPLVQAPAEWLWQTPEEAEHVASETMPSPKPQFVTPAELPKNLGDIVISWPTIKRQASAAGHGVDYELLFLLCHGVLHLVGYDDQTEAGYAEMVRLQKEVLAEIYREG